MMLDIKKLQSLGQAAGFTHVAPLDCSTIQLMPDVRQMCAVNPCHMYGKTGAVLRDAVLWRNVGNESGAIVMASLYRQ